MDRPACSRVRVPGGLRPRRGLLGIAEPVDPSGRHRRSNCQRHSDGPSRAFSDALDTGVGSLQAQVLSGGNTSYVSDGFRVTDTEARFEIFETPQTFTRPLADTDVSVDVTIQQAGDGDSRGLICRAGAGSNASFYGLYYSNEYALITFDSPNPADTRILAKVPNTQFTALSGDVHLEAQCTGVNPVRLALYVNGVQLAATTDTASELSRGSAGVFVRNDSGQTTVVDFRNLQIGGD